MQCKHNTLPNVLIAALLPAAIAGEMYSLSPSLIEQTLEAIQNCMAQSPGTWPDEWKREYIETVRQAIGRHRDASFYTMRLKVLREGFSPFWKELKKGNDRPSFEVNLAQIQWYVEYLMQTEFPSEDERKRLRDQYTDIWNYAADSLLAQFPFLDPNTMQKAMQDDLKVCYRKIETPLMPVYIRPLTEEQVAQIKTRWDKLRYARIDLWRRLSGGETTSSENGNTPSLNAERYYQLTKENLSQLLGIVWVVVPQRPDYYLNALENRRRALRQRVQSKQEAQIEQQRLEKTHSRQLLQAEHLSFLLTALIETPQGLDKSASVGEQELAPLEQRKNLRKEVVTMR